MAESAVTSRPETNIRRSKHKPLAAFLIFVAEAALLVYAYRYDLAGLVARPSDTYFCLQIVNSKALCNTLSRMLPMILLLFIIAGFLRILRPQPGSYVRFRDKVVSCGQPNFWLGVNLLGCAFILTPYFLWVADVSATALIIYGQLLWLTGTVAFTSGLIFWLLPAREIFRLMNWKAIVGIAFLLTLPQLDAYFDEYFAVETFLQNATLDVAIFFLLLFNQPVITDGTVLLGIEYFRVNVGWACAGLSGILFSSSAMVGYILWMRSELIVGRALAIVPLVALLSWIMNGLRIALLVMLGEHVSPTLAVEGFHSYAGWINFTLLTCAMVFAVDRMPWFQKAGRAPRPKYEASFWHDPTAAQILPFTVFLFSSMLVGAIFDPPNYGYPLRILLAVGFLVLFWRCLPSQFNWKADPLALGAGVVIAVMWLLGQPDAESALQDIVPGLGGSVLILWVIIRIFGTSVVVPIIEELFFRGYLLGRFNFGGSYGPWIALVVSSVLFAALHGNFLLAFLAGMIFAALVMRSGRVLDAIYAHAVANLLIAIFALLTNNWAVI